jgi:predicted pyridoxine 5'-phosphate oxidase superfamily flavin-nucleotide-binding protein
MTLQSVYHEGELTVQQRAKETRKAQMAAQAIHECIPDGALGFAARQPMVVLGSVAGDGGVWASVLFGAPGFLQARDPYSLTLDASQSRSSDDDPLWENVRSSANVGMLVIELASRRRLRINGRMSALRENCYRIDVAAAYPNCPKYIQRRHWKFATSERGLGNAATQRGVGLDEAQIARVTTADTFFVASAHPQRGVDASHRGGKPGFVRVLSPRTLCIPDYTGNGMFNTLGNFAVYPRAGLAFVDFAEGCVLQLSGRPTILWNSDDADEAGGRAPRFWQLEIDQWQVTRAPLRLDWEFLDYSPFIPEDIAPKGEAQGCVK